MSLTSRYSLVLNYILLHQNMFVFALRTELFTTNLVLEVTQQKVSLTWIKRRKVSFLCLQRIPQCLSVSVSLWCLSSGLCDPKTQNPQWLKHFNAFNRSSVRLTEAGQCFLRPQTPRDFSKNALIRIKHHCNSIIGHISNLTWIFNQIIRWYMISSIHNWLVKCVSYHIRVKFASY